MEYQQSAVMLNLSEVHFRRAVLLDDETCKRQAMGTKAPVSHSRGPSALGHFDLPELKKIQNFSVEVTKSEIMNPKASSNMGDDISTHCTSVKN